MFTVKDFKESYCTAEIIIKEWDDIDCYGNRTYKEIEDKNIDNCIVYSMNYSISEYYPKELLTLVISDFNKPIQKKAE